MNKCEFCNNKAGDKGNSKHKSDCILYVKESEPNVFIPYTIEKHLESCDPHLCYFPIPNTVDDGFYLKPSDLITLLRANKKNPDAIQYITDMMEGYL